MKYSIRIVFTLFAVILSLVKGFAYDWPLVNGQIQHQINSTFGECRGERAYFHNGVDIQASQGTAVVAIESDTAYILSGSVGVNIGHYRYYHLANLTIQNLQMVQAGTIIGYTNADNHIHFIESNQSVDFYGNVPNEYCVNPLRNGALTPFIDAGAPEIDSITIYRQGTNDVVQPGTIYGQLDFAVQAHDPGVAADGTINNQSACGVYNISIEFRDSTDNLIGQAISYLIFDNIPDNGDINWAFATGSNSSTFVYWATNDPFNEPYNKYWNTRQRENSNYNVDARYPGEALYGDGAIRIRVIVEDIAGNTDMVDLSP